MDGRFLIRQPSAEMKYVRLGTSGLKVSRVCLGMMSYGNPSPDHPSWRAWHLDEDAAAPIVRRAVEGGVTFFDTADSYSAGASERVTGGLLRISLQNHYNLVYREEEREMIPLCLDQGVGLMQSQRSTYRSMKRPFPAWRVAMYPMPSKATSNAGGLGTAVFYPDEERAMAQQTENPAIDRLAVFVGEWSMAAQFKDVPPADVGARVVFEWMPGRRFMIQRWEVAMPEAPDGIAIIGADPESDGTFLQHYFDSRGVARVYKMTVSDRGWKLWRDTPDFSPLEFAQRYTGTFGDDGRLITGAWENCHDGATWEHDFDLTYTKAT